VLGLLSQGSFRYGPTGILDITHLRFFTLAGMHTMFHETGFAIEGTWILSSGANVAIDRFPAQVEIGKMPLTVDSAQEWQRLNAIQFGFRLRPKPRA
jgi:hypothetical protein